MLKWRITALGKLWLRWTRSGIPHGVFRMGPNTDRISELGSSTLETLGKYFNRLTWNPGSDNDRQALVYSRVLLYISLVGCKGKLLSNQNPVWLVLVSLTQTLYTALFLPRYLISKTFRWEVIRINQLSQGCFEVWSQEGYCKHICNMHNILSRHDLTLVH